MRPYRIYLDTNLSFWIRSSRAPYQNISLKVGDICARTKFASYSASYQPMARLSTGMNTAQVIEARLKSVMLTWQLPIEPSCADLLNQVIQRAAERVVAEGFASDHEKIWEAETNLQKLLTEMTKQAGALGFNELRGQTFNNAFRQLCPLWPFCS